MTEGQLNRVSVVGMLLCAVLAMPASAQIVHVWDLADVDQPGQLTIYNPSGIPVGSIAVPEPPANLAFGGIEGTTLFITARTSLYAVKMMVKGQ